MTCHVRKDFFFLKKDKDLQLINVWPGLAGRGLHVLLRFGPVTCMASSELLALPLMYGHVGLKQSACLPALSQDLFST